MLKGVRGNRLKGWDALTPRNYTITTLSQLACETYLQPAFHLLFWMWPLLSICLEKGPVESLGTHQLGAATPRFSHLFTQLCKNGRGALLQWPSLKARASFHISLSKPAKGRGRSWTPALHGCSCLEAESAPEGKCTRFLFQKSEQGP